ncbi:ATP-binding protein [Streptomyces sp. V4-01]|uniref:ATP-binding protein n=1 Tax=Actinacidiphila polyblastidii TaxID=3110430 RepID=A0ABU7P3Q9_9ACTN|nr:ATP-binding protein [Streptomyces sp. V4-01]
MSDQPVPVGDVQVSSGLPSAAQARRLVMDLLAAAPGDTSRVQADASLVVSELVSNAERHGGGLVAFRAGLTADGSGLRLQVEDASRDLPHAQRVLGESPDRAGGFGWPIVMRLAASVTVEDLPGGGKRIVAVLPLV